LHHKVQKSSSGTGSPGWSRKKGHKTIVVVDNTESVSCRVLELLFAVNLTGDNLQTSVACYSSLAVLKASCCVTSTSLNSCTNNTLQLQHSLLGLVVVKINFLSQIFSWS